MGHDPLDDGGLFEMKAEPTAFLRDRYQQPPFTVLDRRGGAWIERDRKWKALGIQSEIGRVSDLTFGSPQNRYGNWFDVKNAYMAARGLTSATDAEVLAAPEAAKLKAYNESGGTSVFSPSLCEIAYRWYSAPGARVLDPFAGGSVRGVVASALQRSYTGVELRGEQVEANRAQGHLGGGVTPQWIEGDSTDVRQLVDPAFQADMIFSCPPYAFLEEYSDDPRDLSNMKYPDFLDAYRQIIAESVALLRDNRFAVWVIGEVRQKGGDGSCIGLVADTIKAFQDAGAKLYNDHIILTPIGTAAVRAPRQFDSGRKAARIHEYMLVFVKGDGKKAAKWATGEGQPTTPLGADVADVEPVVSDV